MNTVIEKRRGHSCWLKVAVTDGRGKKKTNDQLSLLRVEKKLRLTAFF